MKLFLHAIIWMTLISCLVQLTQASDEIETLPMETSEASEKNILLFSFPGAKSHIFILRELFRYTIEHMSEENKNKRINFHIVAHNSDLNLWSGTGHKLYGFGDVDSYEEIFAKAMQNSKEDPVMGYNSFNSAILHLYNDFLKDGVLKRIKKIKYDLVMTDIPNYIALALKKEFAVKNLMYLNPTCVHIMYHSSFEYNPAYMPVIGSKSSEQMNIIERFGNFFFYQATRIMYDYFTYLQGRVFKENGYDLGLNLIIRESVNMSQCVTGVNYSMSLPPNFIKLGAVLPKPSIPLTDVNINTFLNLYPRNVYVSQGTITKALRLEVIREAFKHFSNVGFIFSLKKDLQEEFGDLNLPANVLLLSWAPQNDILGDSRVHGFITHGGMNSLLEALYHAKPMIVIGTNIDQVNNAGLVEYRRYGIGLTKDSEITLPTLASAVDKILKDPTYKQNCLQASKYVKESKGKETFYKWLKYILDNGYDHLIIPAVVNFNYFQLHNFDIYLIWALLLYIVYKCLNKLLVLILSFCFVFRQNQEKVKSN